MIPHCSTHLFDLTPQTLSHKLQEMQLPRYVGKQILDWVYVKKVDSWEAMTNLSKRNRQILSRQITLTSSRIVKHQVARDHVQKLLMQWDRPQQPGVLQTAQARHAPPQSPHSGSLPVDSPLAVLPIGNDAQRQTECVMIPTAHRYTACISSQIGCPVGCTFCASGIDGLAGNLTAGQIVEQVWQLGRLHHVPRISHVVFMGMGEPLANFNAVVAAIQTLNAPWGLGISARHITVSTVGLPSRIRQLAEIQLPITLAISLHAPTDQLREQLIPWAQSVSIRQLVEAGRYFFDKTGREVTLEYILLGQVNDQPEHARQLVQLARSLRCNVNLICYNPVAGLAYTRPTETDVHQFQARLKQGGVNVHLRASRGRDITAACGQLRRQANSKTC